MNITTGKFPFGITRFAVQVQNGRSWGSGGVFFIDEENNKTWIITNAHVAGSRIGHRVTLFVFHEATGYRDRFTAEVTHAGYRRGTNLDFAVCVIDGLIPGAVAVPLNRDGRCHDADCWTGGSPSAEPTSYRVVHWQDQDNEQQVFKYLPDAISGQSGSMVIQDHEGLISCCGLVTWSDGRTGLVQSTGLIWDVLQKKRNRYLGVLDKSFEPVAINPQTPDDYIGGEMSAFPDGSWVGCGDSPAPGDDDDPAPEPGQAKITAQEWFDWRQLVGTNSEEIESLDLRIENIEKLLDFDPQESETNFGLLKDSERARIKAQLERILLDKPGRRRRVADWITIIGLIFQYGPVILELIQEIIAEIQANRG